MLHLLGLPLFSNVKTVAHWRTQCMDFLFKGGFKKKKESDSNCSLIAYAAYNAINNQKQLL